MGEGAAAAAWQSLCERLARAGEWFPAGAREQAEGYRHLARQLVVALQGELEHGDPAHPSFHRYEEPWAQWGGPNPDNVYTRARVDPTATYRVWGDVTGVRAAIFSLVDGDMHLGRYGVDAERTLAELDVGAGGAFELWVSPEPRPGNVLTPATGTRYLLVRQYQCDWERDAVAHLRVERLDTRGVPAPAPAPDDVADALGRATRWVEASLAYWRDYTERARAAQPHNECSPPSTPPGGAPSIAYGACWWDLAPGDALVVASDVPDADYWSWTIHTRHWLDSGDFADRQTSVNAVQAHVDADRRVRLVAAATDPGTPNWIDTAGRPEGLLVYRYVGARTRPVPRARVVPLADVRDHLPADHPHVRAEERRDALARRRAAVLARYA
jgi:hypothetical protein